MTTLKLRWPWRRRPTTDRLVVCSTPDSLVYAQADAQGRLLRCGVLATGSEAPEAQARRLRALGLPAHGVIAVLPLAEGQFMEIEAPAVRPEEMKAAARWKVKDLVHGRIDELTLDVMFVGDDSPRPNRHLFVAAARSSTIRDVAARLRAAGLALSVVEAAETAQRNLLSAVARAAGLGERATAALVRHGGHWLLTVCAGGELYYARRLEWEGSALPAAAAGSRARTNTSVAELALEAVDFIDYGAEPDARDAGNDEAPRVVIELQRSFDLWERSWPDLPLAGLWVQAGDDSAALAALLQPALGQPVHVLDPVAVFPGLVGTAPTPAVRLAVLPLLGALLRDETRRL